MQNMIPGTDFIGFAHPGPGVGQAGGSNLGQALHGGLILSGDNEKIPENLYE
jgi:hypothetical protein